MAKQSIDTDRVTYAANKLRQTDKAINKEFQTLQKAAKRLESDWKSSAGSAAHTVMYELLKYNEARSAVLQNYISMLEEQLNPGYLKAENANTKLADKFK